MQTMAEPIKTVALDLETNPFLKRWTGMAALVPDDLWLTIEPLLPPERARSKGGRPRASNRAALAGILLVLRTGIQWDKMPAGLGCCSGKTCWRRLCEWHTAGVWVRLHRMLLERLNNAGELDWSRAALDNINLAMKKRVPRPAQKRRIVAGGA